MKWALPWATTPRLADTCFFFYPLLLSLLCFALLCCACLLVKTQQPNRAFLRLPFIPALYSWFATSVLVYYLVNIQNAASAPQLPTSPSTSECHSCSPSAAAAAAAFPRLLMGVGLFTYGPGYVCIVPVVHSHIRPSLHHPHQARPVRFTE